MKSFIFFIFLCTVFLTSCSSSKKQKSTKLIEDSITSPLALKTSSISNCYRQANKKREKDLKGTLILQWVIDGLGKAKHIATKKNSTRNDELAECVSKVIRTVKFPVEFATRTIQYPFNFGVEK